MSGHTDTIRRAFALGFRMRADGAVISPTGRVRKAYVAPRKPYGTITLRVDGEWRRFFVHKLAAIIERWVATVVARHHAELDQLATMQDVDDCLLMLAGDADPGPFLERQRRGRAVA